MNEVPRDSIGVVHKYSVNTADGSLTELPGPTGAFPWFMGADIPSPHGLAADLNGFVYVGQLAANGMGIRKLSCDGTLLPAATFNPPTSGQFNIATIGNTLYYNDRGTSPNGINTLDVCTGAPQGFANYCEQNTNSGSDWGFHIDPRTQEIYATNGFSNPNRFWFFSPDDFDNDPNTCVTAVDLAGTSTDLPQG